MHKLAQSTGSGLRWRMWFSMDLRRLWQEANLTEQRKLLLTMLDAVYMDTKKTRSVVAIKPKPPFRPIFQVAAKREGSVIRILNEPVIQDPAVFPVDARGLINTSFRLVCPSSP
ncbi:MAG: hypothetical protein HYX96_04805 [Chloroflexi bacterium]|nr:hypothetical protein [Chloroflexota bacterium]